MRGKWPKTDTVRKRGGTEARSIFFKVPARSVWQNITVRLILNFNAPKLIDGLKRVVLTSTNPAPSTAPGAEP
jgi:hypothetical protein